MKTFLTTLVFLLLFSSLGLAVDDSYKSYLHTPAVPEHPEIKLYGKYDTNLFDGAATYTYALDLPVGSGGLKPTVLLSYNSNLKNQLNGLLGSGWNINVDYVMRDENATFDDSMDDRYILVLGGNLYELVFYNGEYRTKTDYYYRIENLSDSWRVTLQDGTVYVFGAYDTDRLGAYYWALSTITDTNGNSIAYYYNKDLFPEDSNVLYPDRIVYNNDGSRVVKFTYESGTRPDLTTSYQHNTLTSMAKRLTDIQVLVNEEVVNRHHFTYAPLTSATSTIQGIAKLGADNYSAQYNITFAYHAGTTAYTNSTTWKPPVLFSNDAHTDFGVRLLDVNTDGFADLIQQKGTGNGTVMLNQRNGSWKTDAKWVVPEIMLDSSGNDKGVRFADIDKDGKIDLIKSDPTRKKIYLNNGTMWELATAWTFPENIVDSSGKDLGIQIVDLNGDGFIDIVKAVSGSSRKVYINNRQAWVESSSWTFPFDFVDTSGRDLGVRIVDLNGDGLVDVMKSSNFDSSEVKEAYLNNGTGFTRYEDYDPSILFVRTDYKDAGVRFLDVNGDGLVDILQDFFNQTAEQGAWLNTGTGWQSNSTWQSPEPFTKDGYNLGRRLADVDGDGLSDLLVSHQDTNHEYAWIRQASQAPLLKTIVNEYGGITSINYTPSTIYNRTDNVTREMGFALYVVTNKTIDNGLNGSFTVEGLTNYSYKGGYYDYYNNEFRGFAQTTVQDGETVVTTSFYQDNPRKGISYQTEVTDAEGKLYSRQRQSYNYTQANGVYNLTLRYKANYLYDGNDEPIITNTSYAYNRFGNYESIVDYGNIAFDGDERYYNYTYAFNTEDWIINKVARLILYDNQHEKVSETRYYYDGRGLTGMGSQGQLTKKEFWNNEGNNTFVHYTYDTYGNLETKTNSLGAVETYTYDKNHAFIESVTNALGFLTYYTYDQGTGNLLSSQTAGIMTNYTYDSFGRPEKEIAAYDSEQLPTKWYAYDFDGLAPERITVNEKTTANNSIQTSYFYDGFGDLVQLRITATNGQETIKNILYDEQLHAKAEQQPYYATATTNITEPTDEPWTNYTYDAAGRVTIVHNPDGTNKTITYNQTVVTDSDENGHQHDYELDARGRIIAVREHNTNEAGEQETYQTTYLYDAADNLIGIIDAAGNVFTFTYDSLGRKIAMDDPDLGLWSYTYDQEGRLLTQTDARGEQISLAYDPLGRVINKNSSDVNITFSYDMQYPGTLANVSLNSNYTYAYTYDKRFRVATEAITLGNQELQTSYAYNSRGQLLSKKIGQATTDYTYDAQGMLVGITGTLTDAHYTAFGALANKTYANNLTAGYIYDPLNNRLNRILVSGVQDLSYAYNAVGNVLRINDSISGKDHILVYDDLDRLKEATIGENHYSYSFNPIGNLMKMIKDEEAHYYTYQGSAVHAPSAITTITPAVDIYRPHVSAGSTKNRTYTFILINDDDEPAVGVNVTINYGDGQSTTLTGLNITNASTISVQHNFTTGGNYELTFTVSTEVGSDTEKLQDTFGVHAISLIRTPAGHFSLLLTNTLEETATDVTWSCSEGETSGSPFTLEGETNLTINITPTYETAGEHVFLCNVTSSDGNDTASTNFIIEGVQVADYDVLTTDQSRKIVSIDVHNDFSEAAALINVSGDGRDSNGQAVLSEKETIFVYAELNYSTDGFAHVNVDLEVNTSTSSYIDTFLTRGAEINDYQRISHGDTDYLFSFFIQNNWLTGSLAWNASGVNVADNTLLEHDQSLLVLAERVLDQGDDVAIHATRDTYTSSLLDNLDIRPLDLVTMQTLAEGEMAITELLVRNNVAGWQPFTWGFQSNDGWTNSSTSMNLTAENAFIYVQMDNTPGVQWITGVVVGDGYSDEEEGVIIA